MKNTVTFIGFILVFAMITSCAKEQRIADQLKGKWKIESISSPDPKTIQPNDTIIQHFVFEKCENAYTASCLGIYLVNYPTKELIDTFRYELKDDQFSVSSVKNKTIQNENFKSGRVFLNKRFTFTLSNDVFELKRVDTIDVQVKCKKVN
jgi:hypothetical protein